MRGKSGDEARLIHILNAISEIEWREIIGLRNILIHEYFGVDENVIWGIISKDLPVLKRQISNILDEL